ncbi:hypothetical protein F7725_000728 [Dissostichus mawsoni]|uniref:PiggyBac transposable element-derived protein domain-containing protein n=1 Tax=Dissostichus mawsoni TaxID=36200 RepID=A0A7J5ZFU9_DISMA|nr:hypothetical protein F7725_000728 [Dissostichus mawsoni]
MLHFTADSVSALHLQEDKRERTNSLPDSPTASHLCPDTLHYFLVARKEDKEGLSGQTKILIREKVQSEKPRAKLQVVKNKDRVFKRSKRPVSTVIPKHTVYSPNAAECIKQSCPDPMDVFLLMYPTTLREITIEMSNLYSTQTKDQQLYLSMEELLTFYGILMTSGYSSVPRRHMYWSLDSDVHNESISDAMRRNRFD